jgi:hypothetical protein
MIDKKRRLIGSGTGSESILFSFRLALIFAQLFQRRLAGQ